MLNFQKNLHAEACARVITRVNPSFLAKFQLADLISEEGMRSSILSILKVYIERREQTGSDKSLELVQQLLP